MEQEQQARIPGFRYRRVTRYRTETTTINGIPETEEVPYEAWELVPPRDWDGVILRGITVGACAVTVLAAGATSASIGGLLSRLVWEPVAYSSAVVLTVPWLACQAAEYYLRREPERARRARIGGWFLLLLSMGAVFTYGATKGEPAAGAIGATIDLASKGMWVLVHTLHHVPLSRGVANWLRRRKEELAADAVLAADTRRLNEYEAYLLAAYPEHGATRVITTAPEAPALQFGAVSGQVPVAAAPAREPAAVQEPASVPAAPQVSGPDPRTVSAPVAATVAAPAPTSDPVAPHAAGPVVWTMSAPVSTPVAAPVPPVSAPVPAAPAVPPVAAPVPVVQLNKAEVSAPLVPSSDSSASVPSVPVAPPADPADGQEEPEPPAVAYISLPTISKVCRDEIKKNRAVTDDELFEAVVAAGHDRARLNPDTIRRTAQKIDPGRKKAS
ncbi:hypothetical protein ACPCSP_25695 [Streptomyces cinereoruber]|uniref:hypothetical protein n=1 Tax=Streptomyces cinereoruber TaxID=67260 RepID=UPI003C2AB947